MGYPFDEATWSVVEGAMYTGAHGIMPGLYTAIGLILCGYILWKGNKAEKERYIIVKA